MLLFGLFVCFLFNGISTFISYSIPKPPILKDTSDTIEHIAGGKKRVHSFPMCLSSKVNVIAKHYTTRGTHTNAMYSENQLFAVQEFANLHILPKKSLLKKLKELDWKRMIICHCFFLFFFRSHFYHNLFILGLAGWGWRIHLLHLCWGVRLPQRIFRLWH